MIQLPTWLILGFVAVCFCILPVVLLIFVGKKANKIYSTIAICCFVLLVFCLTLFDVSFNAKTTSISFVANGQWFSKTFDFNLTKIVNINVDIVVNALMLAPFGIVVTQNLLARGKRYVVLKAFVFGLVLSACIELLQLIMPFGRYPDLLDILLNTISSVAGSCIALVCFKIKK